MLRRHGLAARAPPTAIPPPSRRSPPSAGFVEVFRVTGIVAWAAYGVAYVGDSIWFRRPWSFSVKMVLDALLYAVVTAGVFGWLWPS